MLQKNIVRWLKSLLLLPTEKNASLLLWRISILRMLMLSTLALGVLTVLAMAFFPLPNRNLILAVDVAALLALASVTFYRPLSYTRRAQLSLLIFFGFWVWLFSQIGLASLIYLLAIPLVAALLLGFRTAIVSIPITMLVLFALGMVNFPDLVLGNADNLSGVQSWLIVTLNFGFTVGVITAASGLLINRLEEALLLSQQTLQSQRSNEKLQAIGTLASGVAHDFNNILMIIVALTEGLRERSNDQHSRDNLDQILLSSERGRDIVRQLLMFSRQAIPERKVLDLNALVKEMEPLLRAQALAGVQCQIKYGDESLIVGSAAEIQRVLMNLVGNAVLAIKPEGRGSVDIQLSKVPAGDPRLQLLQELDSSRDYVSVSVRDDGTGIEPQDLPRLFEPFFTTREPGQGTGLGLASCHGIISSLGGGISVESQIGKFSQFTVFLPLCVDPPIIANYLTGTETALSSHLSFSDLNVVANSLSILLVDDEPMILQTSRGLLESAGYHITSVSSAADARKVLESSVFDLLITDYSMPLENGVSLIRHARQLYPALPVILITGLGYLDEPGLETMHSIVLLNKPYRKADLLKAISHQLDTTPVSA